MKIGILKWWIVKDAYIKGGTLYVEMEDGSYWTKRKNWKRHYTGFAPGATRADPWCKVDRMDTYTPKQLAEAFKDRKYLIQALDAAAKVARKVAA